LQVGNQWHRLFHLCTSPVNGKPQEMQNDPLYAAPVKVAQDLDAPLF
jgi:hypothetical protein